MPWRGAAADGCCGKALPFAALPVARGPRGAPLPPAPRPGSPRGRLLSLAMNPNSAAAGEDQGAAGGAGSCCLGAEGGADPRGAGAVAGSAALEEPGAAGLRDKDEALEEKLRNLTFRKQVSYR